MLNNGRLLKVRKDDPRYGEEDEALMEGREPRYPHRKPSKAAKQRYRATEVVGGVAGGLLSTPEARTAAGAALAASTPRLVRGAAKIAKAVGTRALATRIAVGGVATTGAVTAGIVGLLALAGAGSYFATSYIMNRFSQGGRLDAALKALIKARNELRAKLGRELTREELQVLNAHYQQVVREIRGKGGE